VAPAFDLAWEEGEGDAAGDQGDEQGEGVRDDLTGGAGGVGAP